LAGETEAARRVLQDLEEFQGSNKAAAAQDCGLRFAGETDRVFACFEEAYRNRQHLPLLPNVNPEWIAFDRTRAFTTCWQG